MRRVFSLFFLLFICAVQSAELPKPVSGHEENESEINSADVLSRVRLLKEELMTLNWIMGKPEFKPRHIEVSNVTARETYFQAETVLKKCIQLQFELFGKKNEFVSSNGNVSQINPFAVYKMTNNSLEIIMSLKSALKIKRVSKEVKSDESSTQSEVFSEIFTINQLLNQLMSKPVSPSDVYMRVTESIYHAVKIIRAGKKAVSGLPQPDDFQEGKKPTDVYRRLLGCYEQVQKIASDKKMKMMKFSPPADYIDNVLPEDVYDLASLVLSEVVFLHSQTPGAENAVPVYFPGLKFPSHVYQRVSILEKQLDLIQQDK
ncbi:MAG: hypothetical protein NE327_14940 [Lentisphaeraceae bacterium]|nr:hypothetical protein [Lentisphaeraceae bacterium]